MLRRLIIFLVRKKLGLKKYQTFQFKNQKSDIEYYWFNEDTVRKMCNNGIAEDSSVSLNWLLSDDCVVIAIDTEDLDFPDDD